MTKQLSRLAPSPTGALHLGNARTFLVNWALARQRGWTLLMRIEDLDGPRTKPDAEAGILDTLAWLGIDFDGPVTRQSEDLEPYRAAMRHLAGSGLTYSCDLSRAQIRQAAAAPHGDDGEVGCPPHLRPDDPHRYRFDRRDTNYRLLVPPDETVPIDDELAGHSLHRPGRETGDFVIWTRRDQPAYQLAVVVDDSRQHVTDVVRGDDLLPSAARQTLLYRALGATPPRWWHLPLVRGTDGRRLAKRHGDTRLEHYRRAGVAPERIVGLLAHWCGVVPERRDLGADSFQSAFTLDRLSREPITFTREDDAWLMDGATR